MENSSDKRYDHSVSGLLPQPILIIDKQTSQIRAINSAAVQFFQFDLHELLQDAVRLPPPLSKNATSPKQFRSQPNDIGNLFPYRYRKKDGTPAEVMVSCHGLELDGNPVLLILAHGNTEFHEGGMNSHENEMRKSLLMDLVPFVLYTATCGPEFKPIWIDGNVEKLTGFPAQRFLENPNLWVSRLHELDRNRVLQALEKLSTYPKSVEYRWKCADGKYRWFLDTVNALKDDKGNSTELVGCWFDISQRKMAEESRRSLSAIVESSNDAIIGENLDGMIFSWNPGAEALYGYSVEEVIGKPASIIVPPERTEEFSRTMDHFRQVKSIDHVETVRMKKDGQRIDVFLAISPIKGEGGDVVGVSTIARDITKRKVAERALVQRNRELSTFYRLSEIILSHRSLDESYYEIVEEVCAATGFPSAAIALYDPEKQSIVLKGVRGISPAGDGSMFEAPVDQTLSGLVIRSGKPVIETHALNNSRKRRSILQRAPVQTFIGYPMIVDGNIIGSLNLTHPKSIDIDEHTARWIESLTNYVAALTGQKRTEEELRKSEERLRDLSQHSQLAIEEERKRIAREIHDDLGQELSLIQLELGLLDEYLPHRQKELRKKIKKLTDRVDVSIQSIQRISSNLRPTILDIFGIGAAIEWQAKDFEARTGITCEIFVDPPDIILDQGKSTALYRILQESLTNIIRHAHATNVEVSFKEIKNNVVLRIKDNGIGILPETLLEQRSFGLMGMRERVHRWGGSVSIRGKSRKGTEVIVTVRRDP